MKLLYIEWLDHCSFTQNIWREKSEYLDIEPVLCKTIGWVLVEDKDKYIIVSTIHQSEEFEDKFLGDMHILKATIKKIKEIKFG